MRKVLLLLGVVLLSVQLFAQQRTITGKITDANGNPVSNASVLIKGSSTGTSTQTDGTFSLSVPTSARTLVVSSVGLTPLEIAIGTKTVINATLQTTDKSLDEVVVVAYGTQKKASITGAIAKVSGEELENRPFTSFDKALQGKVAGLQSVAGSGQPGAAQALRIRGMGSITASNQPLFVVDGVIVNTGDISRLTTTANLLSLINPSDIESVSVLKDAASASLYGSLAANGVILVTTKKGRQGKPRVNFDMSIGENSIGYMNDRFKPMDANEFVAITREGMLNSGLTLAQAETQLKTGTYGDYTRGYNTDWFSLMSQKGKQSQYNLSISGGNDKSTYYFSGGYYDEDGTSIQSNFKRYTASLRGKHFATPRLTITHDISVGFSKQMTPSNGTGFANPIYTAYVLLPTKPAYLADGSYNINTPDFPTGSPFNALYLVNVDKRQNNTLKTIGNITAEYKILNDLKFTSRFGVDYNSLEENQYNNPVYGDGQADNGRAFSFYTRNFVLTWSNFADYYRNFLDDKLKASIKVGTEVSTFSNYETSVRSDGVPPNLDLTLATNASNPKTATAAAQDSRRISYFSMVEFSYEDRYVISGSLRRDGSSRFGINRKYGNFWSVGGTWNVEKEKWMTVSFIDQLKYRISYGTNGNEDGIGRYISLQTYGYGFNYNNQPGSAPNNIGDPDLTWEQNTPFNTGVDVAVFKNRLRFTVDYYSRKTTNLILGVVPSRTVGFNTFTTNIGAMINRGVEVSIGGTPVRSKDITWDITLSFATNKNRVAALNQDKDQANGAFLMRIGQDAQAWYTRQWAGVDPANGDPLWYVDETKSTTTNVYNNAKQVLYGSASPKYFGNLNNTISFRNLVTVDFDLYYNAGNYVRDALASLYFGDGTSPTRNKLRAQLDRWTTPGQITDVPKYILNGNKSSSSFSTRYLAKGDYIRLRNIQVSFNLPKSVTDKLHINALSIYGRGTNLWTWVRDKNLSSDPEQGAASATNGEVFIPKTVTAGLTLSF